MGENLSLAAQVHQSRRGGCYAALAYLPSTIHRAGSVSVPEEVDQLIGLAQFFDG